MEPQAIERTSPTAARKSQNAAGEPPAQHNSNNVTLLANRKRRKDNGLQTLTLIAN
jgi:hypothetical protein